jgi:competence protein ComEC
VTAVLLSLAAHEHVRSSGILADLVARGATVELTGTVASEAAEVTANPATPVASGGAAEPGAPIAQASRYRFVVDVTAVTGRGLTGRAAAPVLVIADGEVATAPVFGSTVRLKGKLAESERGQRVVGLLIASRAPDVLLPPGPVDATTARVRRALADAADGLVADQRGLVPAIAVGDTSRVPADLANAMKTAGLTHVMAVSGAHIAIIGACVLGITAAVRASRWARAVVLVPVMVGFVLLVHPGASVLRAAGMGAVAVVGLVIGRPARAVPALGGTVVVLLILDPWLARDFGFVLSVLATGGLVLLTAPLTRRLERVLPRACAYALAVPAAAQLACAPVIVLLTPAVSMVAIPANLVAAPGVAPATVLGVLAALVAPWWPAAAVLLARLAGLPCEWIALVSRAAAGLPGASLAWPAGTQGALLLACLTVGTLVAVLRIRPSDGARSRLVGPRRSRSRAARLVGALAVVSVVILTTAPAVLGRSGRVLGSWRQGGPPAGWRLVACDVGQGDALVMRTGAHAAVVIDVGPAGGGIDRCLDRLDVRHIDLLVLTHFHADHVGGLREALAGRQVDRALVSPLSEPRQDATWALDVLAARQIPVATPLAGSTDSIGTVGDVRWQVLWPAPVASAASGGAGSATAGTRAPGEAAAGVQGEAAAGVRGAVATGVPGEDPGPNDASLVVWLGSPELSVIALGDLETESQAALARALGEAGLAHPADVVKVAHHGSSKQSPALARLLAARVALVSVGAGNDFGHPTRTALDLYGSGGATVLRTDQCADVVLSVSAGELLLQAACAKRS